MRRVFADAFFYLAILNRDDASHDHARAFASTHRFKAITTQWVLTEVGDAMAKPATRNAFMELLSDLQADPDTEVVEANNFLFLQGCKLYAQRNDKLWSLTDCISFVVMERFGVTEALTADHHFEQAGFVALLK